MTAIIIPHPRHYWGITNQNGLLFTGTHKECWNWFVSNYGDWTLARLEAAGIRIERIK